MNLGFQLFQDSSTVAVNEITTKKERNIDGVVRLICYHNTNIIDGAQKKIYTTQFFGAR